MDKSALEPTEAAAESPAQAVSEGVEVEVEVDPNAAATSEGLEAEAHNDSECDSETENDAEPTPPRPSFPDPRDARLRFLEAQLAERETTLHAYIRAHKKAEQEFEAFKARVLRDQERELQMARGKVVEKMLDVDGNLERTIEATLRGGSTASLLEGLRLVHRLFVERLGELGLERVDPIGQLFDPSTMEALGVIPVTDPAQDNRVVVTMQAGFRLGDRELRPALVQVGRKA